MKVPGATPEQLSLVNYALCLSLDVLAPMSLFLYKEYNVILCEMKLSDTHEEIKAKILKH
jgi:hypothetical protein